MTNKMFKLASLALVAGFMTSSFDSVGMNEKNTQGRQQSMSSKIEIVSFNNDGEKGLERKVLIRFDMRYSVNIAQKLTCNINLNNTLESVQNLFNVIETNMPSTPDVADFIKKYSCQSGLSTSDAAMKDYWILSQAAYAYNTIAYNWGLRTLNEVKFAGDSGLVEILSL